MTPTSDGGKGWTGEAIAYLEEDNGIQRFGVKAETIRRIWNNNKNIGKAGRTIGFK